MRPHLWTYPTAFGNIGEEEIEAMHRVIATRRFTMGEEVEALEEEFARHHGMNHGIMVNSGSSANLIATAALFNMPDRRPLRRGESVMVPALAWATTYAPLVQHGLNLILCDCDETWNAPVLPHYGDSVHMVVGCSILGNPAYLGSWRNWADVEDAFLVEDNCESLGAVLNGKFCGTHGLLNTFSFYYSHQICGMEGGMILTNDDVVAKICRMLRNHGRDEDHEQGASFDEEYHFQLFGYNVRPLEMIAAVTRVQLRKLGESIVCRQTNQKHFRELTAGLPIQHQTLVGDTSPFGLAFLVESPERRRELAHRLRDENIDCRLPTGGSFRLHPYGRPWREQTTPNADEIHRRGMFLGNAPFAIPREIEAAVNVMRDVL